MERRRAVKRQMKGRVNLGKRCQCCVTRSRLLRRQQERVSELNKEQAEKRMWSKVECSISVRVETSRVQKTGADNGTILF